MTEELKILSNTKIDTKVTLPIIKPEFNKITDESLLKDLESILKSNMVTNVGNYVERFELKMRDFLEAKYVIATSSCTLAMILAIKAMGIKNKTIIIPSFSFSATALHRLLS